MTWVSQNRSSERFFFDFSTAGGCNNLPDVEHSVSVPTEA
jgi:hypothetical protein